MTDFIEENFGITQEDCAAFARFYATCEDGEGYDVSKEKMERLAEIGLIRKVRGTTYEFTKFGLVMQDRLIACDLNMGRVVGKCTQTVMLDSSLPENDSKIVPTEPTAAMLDAAVAFALNVSVSGDYNWSAYMRDVWLKMLAAVSQSDTQTTTTELPASEISTLAGYAEGSKSAEIVRSARTVIQFLKKYNATSAEQEPTAWIHRHSLRVLETTDCADTRIFKDRFSEKYVAVYVAPQSAQSDPNGVQDAWISVDERLPEEAGTVLAHYKLFRGEWCVGEVFSSCEGFCLLKFGYTPDDITVTHWQPLPQPPKG